MCGILHRVRLQVARGFWFLLSMTKTTPLGDDGVPSDAEHNPKDSSSEPLLIPDTDEGAGVLSGENSPKDSLSEPILVNKAPDTDEDAGVRGDEKENSPKDSLSEPIPVNKAPDADEDAGVPGDEKENSPKDGPSEPIPVNKAPDTDKDAGKPKENISKNGTSGPINIAPDADEDSDGDTIPSKKRKPNFKTLDFDNMPLEEKRSHYRCGRHYVTLDRVITWPDYVKENHYLFYRKGLLPRHAVLSTDNIINKKVSLWQGDITSLEIDAIVNAANKSLRGGGGVDGCIHRAAGKDLLEECKKLNGCNTGGAKMTSGYKLPAKKVIHTVGPIGENKYELRSCYESCLKLVEEHNLRTIAFCCISTGVYGYPNGKAADVALQTVKEWLKNNEDAVDRIIFCVFLPKDVDIYSKLMLKYFPSIVTEEDPKGENPDDSKATDDPKIASKDKNPKISDDRKTEDDVKDEDKETGENTGQGGEKGDGDVLITVDDASVGILEEKNVEKKENVEKVEDIVSSKETASDDIKEKGVDFGDEVGKNKDTSGVESLEVEEGTEIMEGTKDNSLMPTDENASNTKDDQAVKKRKREEDDEMEMDVDNKATEVENKMVTEVDTESPDTETSAKDEK